MSDELLIAVCLMLVIEGILPFVAPRKWRSLVRAIDRVDDRTMRLFGLASMMTGTILLLIIN